MRRRVSDALWEDSVTLEKLGKRASPVWRRVAELLRRPRSIRPAVNVEKISKIANDGDVVIVPGKVLAGGEIRKRVKVVAYSISESAKNKLEEAGCEYFNIMEFAEQNPNIEKPRLVI